MRERDLSRLPLGQIARVIRELVRAGVAIQIIDHAVKAMRDDNLSVADIVHVLRGCTVSRCEMRSGQWRYTCLGRTAAGERVEVAVRVFSDPDVIRAITVFALKVR